MNSLGGQGGGGGRDSNVFIGGGGGSSNSGNTNTVDSGIIEAMKDGKFFIFFVVG